MADASSSSSSSYPSSSAAAAGNAPPRVWSADDRDHDYPWHTAMRLEYELFHLAFLPISTAEGTPYGTWKAGSSVARMKHGERFGEARGAPECEPPTQKNIISSTPDGEAVHGDYTWRVLLDPPVNGTANVDPVTHSLLEAVCGNNVEAVASLLQGPGATEAAKKLWVMRLEAKGSKEWQRRVTGATAVKKKKKKKKQRQQDSTIAYSSYWPTSLVGCCRCPCAVRPFLTPYPPLPPPRPRPQIHVALNLMGRPGYRISEMLDLLYPSGAAFGHELMMGAIAAGHTTLVAHLYFNESMDIGDDHSWFHEPSGLLYPVHPEDGEVTVGGVTTNSLRLGRLRLGRRRGLGPRAVYHHHASRRVPTPPPWSHQTHNRYVIAASEVSVRPRVALGACTS